MKKVAVTRRVFDAGIERLSSRYEVSHNQAGVPLDADALAARLRDVDGFLAMDRVDEALLARCPKLRVVANIGVGYNNIDVPACTRRGILVSNTPDVLNESTADYAWSLLMAAARRVGESERWLRAGKWQRPEYTAWMGRDLNGSTLGVVGMGRIGRAVARRASGFSMRVVYHNRTRLAPDLEQGAEWLSLDDLLRTADHVVLVVPYSKDTHHLVGARELALMKPTAVLVNIARGGVVDDAALIETLRSGRIAAAGLDVYENEPALNQGFLGLENAVLSPHIASATERTRLAMMNLAIDNLIAGLEGRPQPNVLNPEALAARKP
jgi:gluconate 2-dehydrogenase